MKDYAHLHDLCRLRSTLEAFAVQRWRQRIGGELRCLLGGLKRLAAQGDYPAFHNADQQFHRAAVAAAGLEPLLGSWELVAADLDQWILGVKQSYWPNLMALYREHELLFAAWLAEDDWVAEQATHQHLEAGWYPVKELEELRVKTHEIAPQPLRPGVNPLAAFHGELFEVATDIAVGDASEIVFKLRSTPVTYDVKKQELSCGNRKVALKPVDGKIRLRIFLDRRSIDIFGNDGRVYMPMGAGFPENIDTLELFAKGGEATLRTLEVHELKSIWQPDTE